MKLTTEWEQNCKEIETELEGCDDIIKRQMRLGADMETRAMLYFIEVAVTADLLQRSVIGEALDALWRRSPEERAESIRVNGLGITDAVGVETVEDVCKGILAGDAVLIIDGLDKGIRLKVEGYPNMGVTEAENEAVLRGSKEGFSDSIKSNTALIRKRLRTMDLKVKNMVVGTDSNTNIAVVYMKSKARPAVLSAVTERLEKLAINGVMDSGMIEQMTEQMAVSPFPQYQTTERPDRASMELLKGRILILTDNSPVGLLLPADFFGFFHTPDDYYNRTGIVALERVLRFLAALIAVGLPGFYLAIIRFHPEILPYPLLETFIQAREPLPFSSLVEVLFMEFSFELLREAGVRVPGTMGNTIGIVGGLIIGDAAVSAGLVSPIIVIVVSLTALASFAIPNEEMTGAFRILKYAFLLLAALFGLYGWVFGMFAVVLHLASLTSFDFPYLYPAAASDINGRKDKRDSIFRYPLKKLRHKNLYERRK